MKNFILLSVLLFSVQSFAAICSCDAPPSCGSRPGSCFQNVARGFLGKIFVEKGVLNPTMLWFHDKINYPNTITVGWGTDTEGRHTDGAPVGIYYVAFTSENTFSLIFAPFAGQRPSLIEEFEFTIRYFPTQVESLRTREGRIFLPKK